MYIAWYHSHDYLEFRTNLFGGRAPYVSQDPRLGYLVLEFSAGRESNRLGSWHFAGGREIINNGPPALSIQRTMPRPGPVKNATSRSSPSPPRFSNGSPNKYGHGRRTPIVLFEGGDLRTIDPRSSRSNSDAPGTKGWVRPPTGVLTRLVDC